MNNVQHSHQQVAPATFDYLAVTSMSAAPGAVERVFVDRDFHIVATGAGRVPDLSLLDRLAATHLLDVLSRCVANAMPFPRPRIHVYEWHIEIGWNQQVYTFHLRSDATGDPLDSALRELMRTVPRRGALPSRYTRSVDPHAPYSSHTRIA